jgi:hypothetical protein
MKLTSLAWYVLACCVAATSGLPARAASDVPQLRRQGSATQLIVDGKPFLALAGELGNNTATSMENMEAVWPRLVEGNLNCLLVAVHWAQVEPEEGKYDFALTDSLLQEARRNHLKLVLLWFGSWKNGLSSYAPYWVKKDYRRFPLIRLKGGKTLELLSTFGSATRDAESRAYRALMRHLKEVDARDNTVIAMQIENEVGVLRDSRDRCEMANQAFAAPVPTELMEYLQKHKSALAPELREVWDANGSRTAGTWEQVFGPGRPKDLDMPLRTTSPPLSKDEYDTGWRKLHWPADEVFMAWHYARYVNRIAEEGKAEYGIPVFVNAWLQQPLMAWPGTYPSGGPVPQVHDIWRAGAPEIDMLAPDLYLPEFDDVCARFTRNGNPLFIPETRASVSNVMMAFGKHNAIGYSPFGVERGAGVNRDLAAAYRVIAQMAPVIVAHQGRGSMTGVRMRQGDPPKQFRLGDYMLTATYLGSGRVPIAPEPPEAQGVAPARTQPVALGVEGAGNSTTPMEAAAIVVVAGADEYYMGGGGIRFDISPATPGPALAGLGIVQEGKFVNGKWVIVRQLGGDDIGQGEFLPLRPNTILRVLLYRYE